MKVSPCSVRAGLSLQKKLPWYYHIILKVHAEIEHSNLVKFCVFILNQRDAYFYISSQ